MANLQVGVAGNGTVTVGSGASVHSPSNNVLTFGTNNSERLRIDASGRLLIGTTTEGSTTAQEITLYNSGNGGITIRNGTSSNGNIYFSDATSGSGEYRGYVQYRHNDDKLVLGASATEKVHITSTGLEVFTGNGAGAADPGYGIKVFGGTNHRDYPGIYMEGSTGADNSSIWAKYNLTLGCDRTDGISGRQVAFANGGDQIAAFSVDGLLFGSDTATANALNDYEEGSWTPVPARYTGGNANLSMSTQNGKYTKIGNMVRLEFYIVISSVTSQGSSLTQLRGLPFLPNASYQNTGVCFYNDGFQHDNDQDYTIITTVHQDNGGVVYFKSNGCDAGNGLATKDFIAGTITGSCTYLTDS